MGWPGAADGSSTPATADSRCASSAHAPCTPFSGPANSVSERQSIWVLREKMLEVPWGPCQASRASQTLSLGQSHPQGWEWSRHPAHTLFSVPMAGLTSQHTRSCGVILSDYLSRWSCCFTSKNSFISSFQFAYLLFHFLLPSEWWGSLKSTANAKFLNWMNLFCLRSCDKASGPQEEKAGPGHPGHSKPVGSGDLRSQRKVLKDFTNRSNIWGWCILGLLANL